MGAKTDRLEAIRKILVSRRISDQGELIAALEGMGIRTTQATLSRDLRLMNVVKRKDAQGFPRYVLPDSLPPVPRRDSLDHGIFSIEVSLPFAVVKTSPGYAGMVGSRIDAAALPGLMGTVAGDDTILMIMRKGAGSPVPDLEAVFPGISSKEIKQ